MDQRRMVFNHAERSLGNLRIHLIEIGLQPWASVDHRIEQQALPLAWLPARPCRHSNSTPSAGRGQGDSRSNRRIWNQRHPSRNENDR